MTPEGKVLTNCKEMLKKLEFIGHIKHWTRLNVGTVINRSGYLNKIGREGESDLLVFVPCDEICWVLFLEVKSETGRQSEVQKEFENKFLGLQNVIYALITDAKQIKNIVHNIRIKSKNYGKLEDWELPETIG